MIYVELVSGRLFSDGGEASGLFAYLNEKERLPIMLPSAKTLTT